MEDNVDKPCTIYSCATKDVKDELTFTEDLVHKKLVRLELCKLPGPDGFQLHFLK